MKIDSDTKSIETDSGRKLYTCYWGYHIFYHVDIKDFFYTLNNSCVSPTESETWKIKFTSQFDMEYCHSCRLKKLISYVTNK